MVQNETTDKFLHQNCRDNWPEWTCVTANVCGLCSMAIWFVVLLPQVWKNFRRKSVRGLSILWGTANFTASLINLFFVFLYAEIPLYGQISSVYSPVLELTILVQFWIYGNYRRTEKFAFLAGCLVIWGVLIAVELIFSLENFVEYAAILLWCIETFPQVILNMKLQSTSGQSTGSVLIAMVGKTTDFISNNGLVLPLQYVIMVYFSSSVAYINGIQVLWYMNKDPGTHTASTGDKTDHGHVGESSTTDQRIASVTDTVKMRYDGDTPSSVQSEAGATAGYKKTRFACVAIVRWMCMALLGVLLVGCVGGFCLNVGSYFGLFAPLSIVAILLLAHAYLTACRTASFNLR